ncbi:MAG: DUF2239 family protein [Rhodoferax sp.]
MNQWTNTQCTAFEGSRCIAQGELRHVALLAKAAFDRSPIDGTPLPVLIFNDATSDVIEQDWRGTVSDFQRRFDRMAQEQAHAEPPVSTEAMAGAEAFAEAATQAPPLATRGPGRPRLGVVAREVTLLPRHWEWLGTQPGGASVALRKLVELARRAGEVKDRLRQASAVAYKFMSTMAGNEPGFEEASRALFAGDRTAFELQTANWPADVQAHLKKLLTDAISS